MLNVRIGVLDEGLHDRAITRDIEWGVPIPVDGLEGKRIYVWFEAVIGYLSAAKEWAAAQGDAGGLARLGGRTRRRRSYYFIGKDNILFHTLIWPCELMGYGGLNLPYDVPANQYVNFGGWKGRTSRGAGRSWLEYLERYDPDALRY